MVIKEVTGMLLSLDGIAPIECSTPLSVLSVLADKEIIKDVYYADNVEDVRKIYPLGASILSTFEADALLMSYKHLYLEIRDTDAPLTVLLNDSPIANISTVGADFVFDIRAQVRFGTNRVELRYEKREHSDLDYISDISLMYPPRILAFNHAHIDNVVISERYDGDDLLVSLDLSLLGSPESVRAVATLISPAGSVSYSGFNGGHGEMRVSRPELWWPGELGAHSLYHLTVNLYSDIGLCDSYETDVGFRTFLLDCDTGAMTLHGEPFFPLGAVHVKEDNVRPWISKNRLETLAGLAGGAGINTLYIKGRDRLPDEDFLCLADEHGISLWIELPDYTMPETALERKILAANIRRTLKYMSTHPSVTLLIGGGDADPILKDAARDLVPTAIYMSESPDVETFGIPSLPSLVTIRSFTPDEELNFLSPVIEKRCTSHLIDLLGEILSGYRMPHSFDEFIYLTQLLSAKHAEAMALEARCSNAPFGAIFDRLSDTIPQPSQSAIDYYHRPKALWYFSKRFNRPTVVFAKVDGTRVKFYVSNLQKYGYAGRLFWSLVTPDAQELLADTVLFRVDAHAVSQIYECDIAELIDNRRDELCLAYSITDSVGAQSYGTHYFTPMRYFKLEKPEIKVEITGTGREYLVMVSTDKLAPSVALDFGDERVVLDDNFFDLTSTTPRQIRMYSLEPTAVEALRRKLKVTTLYDVGRFD